MRFAQISRDLDAEIGDLLCFWVIFYICRICVKYLTNIMSEVGLLHLSGAHLSWGPIVWGPTERGPKCPFFKGGHLGPEEGHKDNCCISVFLYFESTPQMFSMNIRIE